VGGLVPTHRGVTLRNLSALRPGLWRVGKRRVITRGLFEFFRRDNRYPGIEPQRVGQKVGEFDVVLREFDAVVRYLTEQGVDLFQVGVVGDEFVGHHATLSSFPVGSVKIL